MRVLLIIAFFLTTIDCFATSQIGDFLYYKGKKYQMLCNPLEGHPNIKAIRKKHFNSGPFSTACYRGYIAEWEIKNKMLYLKRVIDWNEKEINIPGLKNVFASWVNGNIYYVSGKQVYDAYAEYAIFFENDHLLYTSNGIVLGRKDYWGMSKKGRRIDDIDFRKYQLEIVRKIEDANILNGYENKRVVFEIISSATSKPKIKLLRSSNNPKVDKLIKAELLKINDWMVLFKLGKLEKQSYTYPFFVRREEINKFTK